MKRANGKSNVNIVRDYLAGERPFVQTGYVGDKDKFIIRQVGEAWTDHLGKKWIQKESGPQTVTRVTDIIRDVIDDKCECCQRELRWGNKIDRKMFFKTRKCFDCLVEEETTMRIKGKFKLYETHKLVSNELSYLLDIKQKLKDSWEYLEKNKIITYVNSNGFVEEWKNEARLELLDDTKKDLAACVKKISLAQKELKKLDGEIAEVLTAK